MTRRTCTQICGLALTLAALAAGTQARAQDDGMANVTASSKEPMVFYGLRFEQAEYRFGRNGADQLAWDGDAFVGTDALKLRLQSEGEYLKGPESGFERLENQLLLQWPVSYYYDAKAGVRLDTPEGVDRTYAVLGVQGLAPQWFEVDADLFLSERGDLSARLDVDYELLITNRIILVPSAEINIALSDDEAAGVGAGLSDIELGLRLSYDLIERNLSPYVGVHYERRYGRTAELAREEGEDDDEFYVVAGLRLMF